MPNTKQTQLQRKTFSEKVLFLKKLFKNPKAHGAIMPSSSALADFIAEQTPSDAKGIILEVGAGTGSFTHALLNAGINPQRLIVIELDEELCTYLRKRFPQTTIIQGNALHLTNILHQDTLGHITTIISGIPLMNLSKTEHSALFESFRSVLHPDGRILQFTYNIISPFSHRKLGLEGKKIGFIIKNIPPASVWSYHFTTHTQLQKNQKQLSFSNIFTKKQSQ